MATVGNWVVSTTLQFKSNASTEITGIAKSLKALREGEIDRTQKAFAKLGAQMLTLGKVMDSSGKIERNVFNSLSKGLTKVTDQTKVAAESVQGYGKAFTAVKDIQAAAFDAIRMNVGETAAQTIAATRTITEAQSAAFRSIRLNLGETAANTRASTVAMNGYVAAIRRAGTAAGGMGGGGGRGGGLGGGAGEPEGLGPRSRRWFFGGGKNVSEFATGALVPGMAGGFNGFMLGMALNQGVSQAIETGSAYQSALITTSSIMGLNQRQQKMLDAAVSASSAKVGVGPVEMMQMARDIGRLTTGTMSSEQSISMIDPMAKYAKILEVTRHMSPEKSVDAALETMHLLRDYSPSSTKHLLNLVLAMGEMMPQDPLKTVTQLKQFAPALKNMGVPDTEIASLMVFAARAGLGTGRGGTGIRETMLAALKPITITSYMQALKNQQADEIFGKGGGEHFYHAATKKQGAYFDTMGYLGTIADFAQKHTGIKLMPEIFNVFGRTGGAVAQLLADPKMRDILVQTRSSMTKSSIGVDPMFESLAEKDFHTQSGRLASAWKLLEKDVTIQLMPAMASAIKSMADALNDFRSYVGKNPASMEGLQKWIKSVGTGIHDFTTFIENNPDFVHGMGEFARYMAILAGVRIAGSLIGLVGKFTMITPILAMIGRVAMPIIQSLVLAAGISGAGITTAIALPLAVAGVIAAITAAFFFPKQLKMVKNAITDLFTHIFEDFTWGLGYLAGKLATAISTFFHNLPGMIVDALKPPQSKKPYTGARTGLGFEDPLMEWVLTKSIPWLKEHAHFGAGYAAAQPPGVRHVTPHAKQTSQGHTTHINVAINGPVYGVPDLKRVILETVAQATKNPMNLMGTNLSNTRTHPNIPQVLAVGTA